VQKIDRKEIRILVNMVGYALKDQIKNTAIKNNVNTFGIACSQTPSAYVPPILSHIKFRTHTKPHAKL
jgi:hypothetical protein